MPYIFASWQLGIFSCTKNTRLLNFLNLHTEIDADKVLQIRKVQESPLIEPFNLLAIFLG